MARPTSLTIQTRDGNCNAWAFRPERGGPWPGVLFFIDALGVRPAMLAIAERIANHGYFVLVPDLFYRTGPYDPPNPTQLFTTPEIRMSWFGKHMSSITLETVKTDVPAFLDVIAAQKDVIQPQVGTTGYCMGGRLSFLSAGLFPDRIAAAASYHGGYLATDSPESPHHLASRMKARVYIAGAIEDQSFTDDNKKMLEEALTHANVPHAVETYAGLRHGWVPADFPVHDAAGAERHFTTLFDLFDHTLRTR